MHHTSKFAGFLLAAGLAFAAMPANAQVEYETDPYEACSAIDVRPGDVYTDLLNYETVFGKPAIAWTEEDYTHVLNIAVACDGLMLPSGNVVSAAAWQDTIHRALNNVYSVAALHHEVMDRANRMVVYDITLPTCDVLLTYEGHSKRIHDNSGDIFGIPLYGMEEDSDLNSAIMHINNCLAFLPEYGARVFGASGHQIQVSAYALLDKALLVRAYRRAWNTWQGKRPTDLILNFHGYDVPPSFTTHADTRALIRRYNTSLARGNTLTLDNIYHILALATGIVDQDFSDIDTAYAEAIKEAVSTQIFEQTGRSGVLEVNTQ